MSSPVAPQNEEVAGEQLSRGLSNRHIQLIAIGGTIGTGLFMGSGRTISAAGPSVILVYGIIGFFLYFVLRAMGELLLSNLEYKSFADFAGDILGPWAAYFTGWTYWFCWIATAIADVVAIASYVAFWWPDLPLWIPGLALIFLLLALNLPSVKSFGELEFWFALIKIVAIVALIIIGLYMVFTGFSSGGSKAAFSNLWDHGGFFPKGFMGFAAGFQIAVFAFVGVELVGTAAAETKDPHRNLPRAVNSVPIRMLLFYIGALFVLMSVRPWTEFKAGESPFVKMFALAGLAAAAGVVNFVVLTSAASSANSGIYSTSRMIYGLSRQGDAPRAFSSLSRNKVPVAALLFSCVFLLIGIPLLYAGGGVAEAFDMITTVSAICFMFVWTIILLSYITYRRRRPHLHKESTFKMPGGIGMCVATMVFFVFVLWTLTTQESTLTALLWTPLWFVLIGIGYLFVRNTPEHRVLRGQHADKVVAEKRAAAAHR
ncbi:MULTISPECIES: amino acid permease [Dermacoccus]|uniref:Amino acid permease n=2 Tax=Dermacoccus TaxID=57495 RepID=A0A417YZA1_9MICO|nr:MULTISPECIES: amino acid permease [Dermacoccus]MBZ4496427.1 amino acid permease [Dermacoccus sp. Tok2021]MBE7372370.1 amino acid permease [Dermacoccus barathri]QNK52162.1 amino acid permease [Dermacoccus sp. PAMC28757]RHW43012.1 amino acid permease [Dermacoccus abyssi]RYI23801.1 amino acid permease [Dermacoccus sp. 147Ba]